MDIGMGLQLDWITYQTAVAVTFDVKSSKD